MKEVKKERLSSFELMRIISMIMIVMWHLIFHSGIYDVAFGAKKFVLEVLVLIGVVHVNSFVLVTGYFQYEKRFSLKRLISIINSVWFYKVVFLIIALIIGTFTITKLEIFNELLPIDMRDYWFVNCYLVLYIISPYINILIDKLSHEQHRKLIIISFVLFSIIPLVTNNTTISNNGYTIINFCYLYLIGAYLRKYPLKDSLPLKKYSRKQLQLGFLVLGFFFFLINFICYQVSKSFMLMNHSLLREIGKNFFVNYRSFSNPFVIIQSILYFLYFSTLMIKSNFINSVAKHVLDVYLIHENFYVIQTIYIWLKTLNWLNYNIYIFTILVLIVPVFIFWISIGISLIKAWIFKIVSSIKTVKKMSDKFYDFMNCI